MSGGNFQRWLVGIGCAGALLTAGAAPASAAVGFAPKVDYGVGGDPFAVAIGDLDEDGDPDLVSVNQDGDNVSVLLGNGDGSFAAATGVPAGESPEGLAIGDLDADGHLDVITANWGGNDVSVLLGKGDGTFAAPVHHKAGRHPVSVAIGDFDNDGDADLATANKGSGDVSVLLGNGDGTFQDATAFPTGPDPDSIATGDLDNDGNADLVTSGYLSEQASVLLGNGDGTFQAATDHAASGNSIAIADLDGDGNADLAGANEGSNAAVALGTGTGDFGPPTYYAAGPYPSHAAIGDLNGDGSPDLAVASEYGSVVAVLLNAGDGTFTPPVVHQAGVGTYDAAIGDLDSDGRPDLVTANKTDDTLSVLLQATPDGEVSPGALTFPTTQVGDESTGRTVTLSNTGDAPLTGITPTPSSGFAVTGSTCGATLDAGESCTITVVSAPVASGPQSGTLTIAGDDPDGPQIVVLSGDACDGTCFQGRDDSGPRRRRVTFTTAAERDPSALRVGRTLRAVRVTIDWGDGTSTTGTAVITARGEISLQGDHYYRRPGTYDVITTVIDGRSTANHNQGDTQPQIVHSQITIT